MTDGRFDGTWERRGLWILGAFTALSLLGFATFGRHPELLARFPSVAGLYAPAYVFFARGHIALAFLVIGVVLYRRGGTVWVPGLLVVVGVSLTAELLGTTTGFPFGRYAYTELLGFKIAGHVPALIPLSWFVMALPAYAIARAWLHPDQSSTSTPESPPAPEGWDCRVRRGVIGALLLTTWDLSLDPAMSHLTPYWTWAVEGGFYGMPWVNLLGWLGTSLVIMAGLDATAGPLVERVPRAFWGRFYAMVLALSVGMVAVAGYWGALVATAVALLAVRSLAPQLRRWALRGRVQGLGEEAHAS